MSALLQRLESAIVRMIATQASGTHEVANSFALATHALSVDALPTGLLVQEDDQHQFRINLYSGESESAIVLPAVVVTCLTGRAMEDVPNIETITVEVTLEASCDSRSGFNSPAWMDQASRWMHSILDGQTPLDRLIEIAEPDIVVSYCVLTEHGRASEGRRRIHRWTLEVTASI